MNKINLINLIIKDDLKGARQYIDNYLNEKEIYLKYYKNKKKYFRNTNEELKYARKQYHNGLYVDQSWILSENYIINYSYRYVDIVISDINFLSNDGEKIIESFKFHSYAKLKKISFINCTHVNHFIVHVFDQYNLKFYNLCNLCFYNTPIKLDEIKYLFDHFNYYNELVRTAKYKYLINLFCDVQFNLEIFEGSMPKKIYNVNTCNYEQERHIIMKIILNSN